MNFYSVCAFFVLFVSNLSLSMQQPEGMQVKVFNVGQGSCAVVTSPGQPSLLVDAGSSQLPATGKHSTINQIASHINNHSHAGLCVILSHPNIDHYIWLPEILSRVNPLIQRNLTFGGKSTGYINAAEIAKQVNYDASDSSTLHTNTTRLPRYCSILHAGIIDSKNDNDQSIIVQVEDQNFRVILPGDAGAKTLHQMRFPPRDHKKTYFVASHHGASNDGANSFTAMKALNPEAIIISSGMHAGHHHPTAIALTNFTSTTASNQPEHSLLAQTGTNIFGESSAPVIATYHGGFSLYRTNHPIYGTNNAGTISITAAGIVPENFIATDNATNVLHSVSRNYISTFNFDSIKHLLLARMGISDTHVQSLTRLPAALRYFDLEHNAISTRGFARLLSLLQAHSGRTAIKTRENNPTDINVLRPILEPSNGTHAQSVVNLNWNTVLGYRSLPGEQVSQLNTIVSTPKSEDSQSEPWTLNFEQMNTCLDVERSQGAQYYSTELFYSEPEIFFHHANKTQWRSSLNNFKPLELHHPGVMIKAGWHKKNNFFLSDGNQTYIFEGGLYKNNVWGSPFVATPIPDQKTGINHVTTCPSNGTGERELANLGVFRLGTVQPISKDGTALVTICNGNTLLIHKKNNGFFTQVASRSFPNIKSAGFCDADQSISVEFTDGTKKLLPLIMETI